MGRVIDKLLGVTPAMLTAEAVALAPVGTVATSEGALRELDPVAAAAFGIPTDDTGPVTRQQAMRVPGIRRGRNLICSTIATLPLVADRGGRPIATDHPTSTLLRTLDPRTTPAYTLAWTVDDLLFRGIAWWRVTARDQATNYPTAVERLGFDRVLVQYPTADSMGRVYVDGREAEDRDLIRFDGLDEGLLHSDGGTTIRLALALLRAAKRVADDDWSGMVMRLADGAPELSTAPSSAGDGTARSQVDLLLDTFQAAINARTMPYANGAVQFDNVGVNAQQRQLNELTQLVSSELARLLNLPASRIGAPQGSGMTYTNTEGDRRDLVDTTLAPFLTAIAQRLSMGDVTPYPQQVTFDLTAYLRGTTTELVSAGAAAVDAGFTDPAEVRTKWLGLPPRDDLPAPQEGTTTP
jgi:HK97 family phage portal protein